MGNAVFLPSNNLHHQILIPLCLQLHIIGFSIQDWGRKQTEFPVDPLFQCGRLLSVSLPASFPCLFCRHHVLPVLLKFQGKVKLHLFLLQFQQPFLIREGFPALFLCRHKLLFQAGKLLPVIFVIRHDAVCKMLNAGNVPQFGITVIGAVAPLPAQPDLHSAHVWLCQPDGEPRIAASIKGGTRLHLHNPAAADHQVFRRLCALVMDTPVNHHAEIFRLIGLIRPDILFPDRYLILLPGNPNRIVAAGLLLQLGLLALPGRFQHGQPVNLIVRLHLLLHPWVRGRQRFKLRILQHGLVQILTAPQRRAAGHDLADVPLFLLQNLP